MLNQELALFLKTFKLLDRMSHHSRRGSCHSARGFCQSDTGWIQSRTGPEGDIREGLCFSQTMSTLTLPLGECPLSLQRAGGWFLKFLLTPTATTFGLPLTHSGQIWLMWWWQSGPVDYDWVTGWWLYWPGSIRNVWQSSSAEYGWSDKILIQQHPSGLSSPPATELTRQLTGYFRQTLE